MKKLFAIMIFSGMVMSESISNKTKDMKKLSGYFNMYWDNTSGKLWLEINDFDKEFLYVNSLTAGVGSNDIGLDRGQLGNERIVFFKRVGPKVLMIQPNYYYRAITKDKKEQKSVADGFAKSTLWGFEVAAEQSGRILVDATDFFMQDAHGVINRLKSQKMGDYEVDASRSVIYMPGTMNFPENPKEEIEAVKESMNVLFADNRKKSLITAYQFIAPAMSIYDYSPNQWHHPTVSFPIKGQKYFEIYKVFFISGRNSCYSFH